ncbi:hypothetical protein SAMN03084138_00710 [Enterovibrio norvegicus DSM 15893]|uniref:Uncharacterized protein n=1 Tax=Enterovibrio norvegicus DSM 15893 TaxID=1121869 RepID=A0A1I5KQQ7_9GAMM|nr:hypothetical protein SAMN03084138_00710 [Enterovibrio norvegicus DSM 15893]
MLEALTNTGKSQVTKSATSRRAICHFCSNIGEDVLDGFRTTQQFPRCHPTRYSTLQVFLVGQAWS